MYALYQWLLGQCLLSVNAISILPDIALALQTLMYGRITISMDVPILQMFALTQKKGDQLWDR